MEEITIGIRAFTYTGEVVDPITEEPRKKELLARRGDTIEVNDADYERAVRFGAIEGQPYVPDEEVTDDSGAIDIPNASVAELSEWLVESKPTVTETVDAAEGDKEIAERLLEAERHATGHTERIGVVEGLTKIIESED